MELGVQLHKLKCHHKKPLSGTLYIESDHSNISKQLQQTSKYKYLVKAVSSVLIGIEHSVFILLERAQILGTLAWGITVHIANGSTYLTFTPKQKNNWSNA